MKKIIYLIMFTLLISSIYAVNYRYLYNPYTAKLDRTISLNQSGNDMTIGKISILEENPLIYVNNSPTGSECSSAYEFTFVQSFANDYPEESGTIIARITDTTAGCDFGTCWDGFDRAKLFLNGITTSSTNPVTLDSEVYQYTWTITASRSNEYIIIVQFYDTSGTPANCTMNYSTNWANASGYLRFNDKWGLYSDANNNFFLKNENNGGFTFKADYTTETVWFPYGITIPDLLIEDRLGNFPSNITMGIVGLLTGYNIAKLDYQDTLNISAGTHGRGTPFLNLNVHRKNIASLNSTQMTVNGNIQTDTLLVKESPVECTGNTRMTASNMTTSICVDSMGVTGDTAVGNYTFGNTLFIDDSNDRVGIGTSSPEYKVHIDSGTVDIGLMVESTDAVARIALKDSATTSNFKVGMSAEGDDLNLFAGGSKRITILESGNVGIGTINPIESFHVNGSRVLFERIDATPIFKFYRTDATIGNKGGLGIIRFGGSDDADEESAAQIKVQAPANNGAWTSLESPADIIFVTTPKNSLVKEERMIITSEGDVGIGAVSPSTKLHINDSSLIYIIVESTGAGLSPGYKIINDDLIWVTRVRGDAGDRYEIADLTNSVQPFRIAPGTATNTLTLSAAGDGRVGIGVLAADSKLEVNGNVNLNNTLYVETDGNVGIGTSSPVSPLQVKGQSTSPENGILLTTNTFTIGGSGSTIRIGHGASSGNTYGIIENMIAGGTTQGNLILQPTTGNVGIGTTTPNQKLVVIGDVNITGNLIVDSHIYLAQDSLGGQALNTIAIEVNLDTELLSDSYYTLSNNKTNVSTTGTYWLEFQVGVNFNSAASTQARDSWEAWVERDSGAGFVKIPQTWTFDYWREAGGFEALTKGVPIELTADDEIRLMTMITTGVTNDAFPTVAEGSDLSLWKME